MGKLTFTVFSDLHHHPAWYKVEAPERLTAIQQRAVKSGSAFLLHLGDFSHQPSLYPELIRQYREFSIPGYFVLGNHEFDIDYYETVLETMGMESNYYYFDKGGFRFIQLDENYFRDFPGVYFHYSARNYFDHPQSRDWMPPEEIDWLRETVKSSPFPCVLSSHAPLDYPNGSGVKCKEPVKEIIANSKNTPGEVILCMNGHYHRTGLDIIDGVARLDVNSASFNWVPKPHYFFPEELYLQYECIGNQVIYADPLSAVVTLDSDARTIDIEGCESTFVGGIDTEKSGNKSGFRLCTPDMVSGHIDY